jgi:WD40 repeat protein
MMFPTFSPDSQTIVSGAHGASLKVWNVANGQLNREIPAADFPLKFSPDGSLLATSDWRDRSVKLWRMK